MSLVLKEVVASDVIMSPQSQPTMAQPAIPKLAIIIPSYRWNALAREMLCQAAAISNDDIVVHVGDNSVNAEKHAFLHNLAEKSHNFRVTCHATNLGADKNWQMLAHAQTATYMCMGADDDTLSGAYYRAALNLLESDPNCATAAGLHITIAKKKGQQSSSISTARERVESTPLNRIRNYRNQNTICYAITRRSTLLDFSAYVESNPLECPFNDYMLAWHLLSMGTYRVDDMAPAYVFDNSHWQLNDSFISSNKRWYRGFGLSETMGYLTRLHWAVVAVHFFSSRFRSPHLGDDAAEQIVSYLFHRQRTEFLHDYHLYKTKIEMAFHGHPNSAAACRRLTVHSYTDIFSIFDDFRTVLEAFAPEIAERYRAFQADTLHPGAYGIKSSWTTASDAYGLLNKYVKKLQHLTSHE